MRLTKSQLFALLALGIPIIAWLAWFLLAEMRSWLGLEPWSRDGIQVQLSALIVVALSALGPLVLGPSALLVAAPSSSWAKQVRFIGLNILGVVYLLTGGLFLVGALLEREPAALPFVACLPVAARIYYGLAQEVNFGATARRLLKRMTPWLVVLVVYLVFGLGTLAAAFGAKAIDVAAVTFVVAWLPFLPLVFLLSFAVIGFSGGVLVGAARKKSCSASASTQTLLGRPCRRPEQISNGIRCTAFRRAGSSSARGFSAPPLSFGWSV